MCTKSARPRSANMERRRWKGNCRGSHSLNPWEGGTALHRNIKTEKPDVSEIFFWSWFPTLGFSVRWDLVRWQNVAWKTDHLFLGKLRHFQGWGWTVTKWAVTWFVFWNSLLWSQAKGRNYCNSCGWEVEKEDLELKAQLDYTESLCEDSLYFMRSLSQTSSSTTTTNLFIIDT